MTNLAFTHDEVVAVASLRDSGWPTRIDLSDIGTPTAADAAARRGARSLLARGLLGMTVGRAELSHEVTMPLERMSDLRHVVVYPARSSDPTDALYPLLYVHPSVDGEVVVELDSGDGIRGVTTMSNATVADHLTTTARSVFRREQSGDRPVLHLARVHPDGVELTVVSPGEIVVSTIESDGSATPSAVTPFFDTAIIRALLEPLGLEQEEQSA
ncbi:hypothetical protein [uncultured Williamsia sp.]|uniref:hypothetical protein n=1 Tax=uncultured Williamsia sp. TaxID=259311 RepID=UPI00260D62DC|nr:hypothetical protein [uncultured Williamsia sp.]